MAGVVRGRSAGGRVGPRAERSCFAALLNGLTEEEFAYILTIFPLVPDRVKIAARNAYRDVARGAIR